MQYRSRLPGFGRLGPGLFYAQGFSGHGVALTTLAGKLIAEAVAGRAERFDVFARLPQPGFPGGTLLRRPGWSRACCTTLSGTGFMTCAGSGRALRLGIWRTCAGYAALRPLMSK